MQIKCQIRLNLGRSSTDTSKNTDTSMVAIVTFITVLEFKNNIADPTVRMRNLI